MDDIRWFAPNRLCSLVVPRLRELGLTIALEDDRPARLAVAMDAQVAAAAYAYSARRHIALIHYVWDLPPWRLGSGRSDGVWYALGRYWRLPRLGRGYAARRGYYSRLRFVARHAREVWVPSALTAASVQQYFGVPSRRVPFCYDSDRFRPAAGPAPSAPRPDVLLSISRLSHSKNHEAVIRAAARGEPKLPVRIIGEGPEHGALARLARDLGVSCAIESGLSDDAILAAYRAAGVVVCPSRFEGFGLTPMEAIACGVPVVVSDIPPHREFLDGAPYFFPLEDEAALAAAVAAARAGPPPSPSAVADLTIAAAAQRFFAALTSLLG